ncbi:MAG TPA: type II secretion system F family protein [Candidatus Acidoferrales bacterium]
MIWVATGITFLTAVVIVVAFAYAFSSGVWPTAERLTRLWHPPSVTPEAHFRERQKERVQRVLTDVGKLLPASTKQLSRTQRLLVRAGYRNPETATVMRGVKILLPLGLLALVFFTKIYRQNLAFFALAGLLGFLLPEFWLTWRIRRRQHRIRLGLPDALDLLVVCVEAGLGLDQAIVRVSQELRITHPQLSEELQLVNLEMRVGKTRIDALRELAVRTGVEDIKALVAMLIQTDRFGTSVAQSLRVHSDNLRTKRRQRAEEKAAKTPVKMVPVLVFFIFPALFVVILGPAVISLARQLLPILNK